MKSLSPREFFRALKGILDARISIPRSFEENPVLQVLLQRRSRRKFRTQPVPEEVIEVILEAGRLAPSAVNLQSWLFGVFDRESWKETFGRSIPFNGDRAVIVCGDMHRIHLTAEDFPFKPLTEYTLGVMNASIAAYAMNIAAEACGVSSIMLSETGQTGFYDARFLREKLGLPEGVYPVMTLVFGYSGEKAPPMPPKLPLEAVTFRRVYRQPEKEALLDWLKQMQAGYRAVRITESFRGQLNRYLSKADEAERGLHEIIFYKPEEMKKNI